MNELSPLDEARIELTAMDIVIDTVYDNLWELHMKRRELVGKVALLEQSNG